MNALHILFDECVCKVCHEDCKKFIGFTSILKVQKDVYGVLKMKSAGSLEAHVVTLTGIVFCTVLYLHNFKHWAVAIGDSVAGECVQYRVP